MGIETLSYNKLLKEWLDLGNVLQKLIRKKAKIKKGNILDVTDGVNLRVDKKLYPFGKIIANAYIKKYGPYYITNVLTVESSGTAFAVLVGEGFYESTIIAKKNISLTLEGEELYSPEAESYTKGEKNKIVVKKSFIKPEDRILIVDDFIATGNATFALIDIINKAGAELAGIAALITKDFKGQEGYKILGEYIKKYNIDHKNSASKPASLNTLVRITDMSTTPENIKFGKSPLRLN
ncbi:hypothetical protein FP803_03400 [Candidatus Woesearchaeota archaeon]|nr:hypothetical protein [Candidatus Woesearchaeota archaeon]